MLWIFAGIFALTVGTAYLALRHRWRRQGGGLSEITAGAMIGRAAAPSFDIEPVEDGPIVFGRHHVQFLADPTDSNRSVEEDQRLLAARRISITDTDVRKLVKLDGTTSSQRERLLDERLSGIIRDPSAESTNAGRKPAIAALLERQFGIDHNTMLCVGANARHLATPDGIGDGVISGIKLSSKSWEQTARGCRDELQWQLHVTASDRLLLAVEDRNSRLLHHGWVVRDGLRIAQLVEHADAFIRELDERRGARVRVAPVDRYDWSTSESERMLASYAHGTSLLVLAQEFDVRVSVVVHELARRLLNVHGPLNDSTARRFGDPWTKADSEELCLEYHEGIDLKSIAERMGWDQLTLAFQLLNAGWVAVPDELPATVEPLSSRRVHILERVIAS